MKPDSTFISVPDTATVLPKSIEPDLWVTGLVISLFVVLIFVTYLIRRLK